MQANASLFITASCSCLAYSISLCHRQPLHQLGPWPWHSTATPGERLEMKLLAICKALLFSSVPHSFATMPLCLYSLCWLLFSPCQNQPLLRKYELGLHIFPIVFGLTTAIIPVVKNYYHNASLWCWIEVEPECVDGKDLEYCDRSGNLHIYRC